MHTQSHQLNRFSTLMDLYLKNKTVRDDTSGGKTRIQLLLFPSSNAALSRNTNTISCCFKLSKRNLNMKPAIVLILCFSSLLVCTGRYRNLLVFVGGCLRVELGGAVWIDVWILLVQELLCLLAMSAVNPWWITSSSRPETSRENCWRAN